MARRLNGIFVNGADEVTAGTACMARNYTSNGFFFTERRSATR